MNSMQVDGNFGQSHRSFAKNYAHRRANDKPAVNKSAIILPLPQRLDLPGSPPLREIVAFPTWFSLMGTTLLVNYPGMLISFSRKTTSHRVGTWGHGDMGT